MLLTTFVKNVVAPMGQFAIHGFWKHPIVAVMAFAMVSYFGLISMALAARPTFPFPWRGKNGFPFDWCEFAAGAPWC